MYNWETLKDLTNKIETWNEKYDPGQDFLQIKLFGEELLGKYDLYIDSKEDDSLFIKTSELNDDITLSSFFEIFKKACK